MSPDRTMIYLAIGLVSSGIAAVTGPSPALLSLAQIILVVEAVNLIGAPGDERITTRNQFGGSSLNQLNDQSKDHIYDYMQARAQGQTQGE
ncbi:MAG: hypothetical protein AAF098_12375 [Pseudomonadota bacterium]